MNKLRGAIPVVRRLSAAEAELWIRIDAERITPATEVRGRLVGPRAPGVTTLEVAYPLQGFPKLPEGWPPLSRRAIIPDPNLWEPDRPFVYKAIVELWQDGAKSDENDFEIALRTRS